MDEEEGSSKMDSVVPVEKVVYTKWCIVIICAGACAIGLVRIIAFVYKLAIFYGYCTDFMIYFA